MSEDQKEELLQLIDETACMLRGMTMDPSVSEFAKSAMRSRIEKLETVVMQYAE